jgi:UDP-glucose 4-epimerase
MIVLVTGGAGFIGRHVVEALRRRHDVLAPTHEELDLTDADAVWRWIDARNVDAVVHTAVKPGHRRAPDPTRLVEANLRQFFALVRCRNAFGRFVVLGSGAVYGTQGSVAGVSEDALGQIVPADEHGFSKYVEALWLQGDAEAVELRPFGVYGPGEDYAIRFISNACCKAVLGMPIALRQDRRFSYVTVQDLAAVVERSLADVGDGGLSAGAYNVVASSPIRLRELADLVLVASGKDLPIEVAEQGLGLEYSGAGDKLHGALPGLPLTPAAEGVEALYGWYAAHRDNLDRAALLIDR